jgi:hypothetical protein
MIPKSELVEQLNKIKKLIALQNADENTKPGSENIKVIKPSKPAALLRRLSLKRSSSENKSVDLQQEINYQCAIAFIMLLQASEKDLASIKAEIAAVASSIKDPIAQDCLLHGKNIGAIVAAKHPDFKIPQVNNPSLQYLFEQSLKLKSVDADLKSDPLEQAQQQYFQALCNLVRSSYIYLYSGPGPEIVADNLAAPFHKDSPMYFANREKDIVALLDILETRDSDPKKMLNLLQTKISEQLVSSPSSPQFTPENLINAYISMRTAVEQVIATKQALELHHPHPGL